MKADLKKTDYYPQNFQITQKVGYCRENVPQSWAPQSRALIGPAPALLLQVLNKNYLRMGKEENLGTSRF